jgi:5'-nucleotidase
VRFGVLGLKMKFDLILSGPNRGYNLGRDIVYSGTAGAIFEGARLGIPAVALSTCPDSFEPFFERLDGVKDFFLEHRLLERHSLYNVNVPAEDKGVRITRQGGIYFTDEFVRGENDMYTQEGHMVDSKDEPLCYDTAAICNGYISITPLTAEKTHLPLFEELQNL